jgi:hypothetical protein
MLRTSMGAHNVHLSDTTNGLGLAPWPSGDRPDMIVKTMVFNAVLLIIDHLPYGFTF